MDWLVSSKALTIIYVASIIAKLNWGHCADFWKVRAGLFLRGKMSWLRMSVKRNM